MASIIAFRAAGRTAGVPVTATEVKSTVLLDSVVMEQLFLERLSILPCGGVGCGWGWMTGKLDRAWCQQVHDQPVAVEATGDEAKSEAQCKRTRREIGAAVARPRSREVRCPQQP